MISQSIIHSLLFIILNTSFFSGQSKDISDDYNSEKEFCLSVEEKALFEAINDYRKQKKLPPIALSASLTKVAKAHAWDLNENYDLDQRHTCNPHSWSEQESWSGCCYSDDHKDPNCMWDKPKEIAGYPAAGYEIVYWNSNQAKPAAALEGWKKSPGHNQVIINLDIWKKVEWKAVGVAIYKNYAIAWFGDTEDTKGLPVNCNQP